MHNCLDSSTGSGALHVIQAASDLLQAAVQVHGFLHPSRFCFILHRVPYVHFDHLGGMHSSSTMHMWILKPIFKSHVNFMPCGFWR